MPSSDTHLQAPRPKKKRRAASDGPTPPPPKRTRECGAFIPSASWAERHEGGECRKGNYERAPKAPEPALSTSTLATALNPSSASPKLAPAPAPPTSTIGTTPSWSREEEQALEAAITRFGASSWGLIRDHLEDLGWGRTRREVERHYHELRLRELDERAKKGVSSHDKARATKPAQPVPTQQQAAAAFLSRLPHLPPQVHNAAAALFRPGGAVRAFAPYPRACAPAAAATSALPGVPGWAPARAPSRSDVVEPFWPASRATLGPFVDMGTVQPASNATNASTALDKPEVPLDEPTATSAPPPAPSPTPSEGESETYLLLYGSSLVGDASSSLSAAASPSPPPSSPDTPAAPPPDLADEPLAEFPASPSSLVDPVPLIPPQWVAGQLFGRSVAVKEGRMRLRELSAFVWPGLEA